MDNGHSENQRQYQSHSIMLGSNLSEKYFLTLENILQDRIKADILKFNPQSDSWNSIYTIYFDNCSTVQFINGFWDVTHDMVLVLYCSQNSSAQLLNYFVLGKRDGSIVTYLSENDVYQGSIFLRDRRLIRGTNNQYGVWTYYNNRFRLIPYNMPPIPGAKVIRYSIPNKNSVDITETSFTVPVGTIMQFMRIDYNKIRERFIFNANNPCIEFFDRFGTFKVTCRTQFEFSIIPDSCNWEGAKKISINAV